MKFTLSRGDNFKFTPHIIMYRNEKENERSEFADLIRPFEIGENEYNISLDIDENSPPYLPPLMSFESDSD